MHLAHIRKRLVKQRRFRQVLAAVIILAIVLGFAIVPVESRHPDALITSTSDGLWWSIQTVTTIGYGDVVPVTDAGRLIGVALQILGTILIGILIAMVSSSMTRSQEEFYWSRLFQRLDEIEKKTDFIEKGQTVLVRDSFEHQISDKPAPPAG